MKQMIKRTEITIEMIEITTTRRTGTGAANESPVPDSILIPPLTLTAGEKMAIDSSNGGIKDRELIDHEERDGGSRAIKEY